MVMSRDSCKHRRGDHTYSLVPSSSQSLTLNIKSIIHTLISETFNMNQSPENSKPTKPLPILAGVFRLLVAAYITVLSVMALFSSLLNLDVGLIIASVHLLPASLVLLGLELEVFREYATLRFSALPDGMYPARTIALQFLAAILTGINRNSPTKFIMGCVAFGITVSLVHLGGIHGLFWEVGTSFGNGGGRSKVSATSPPRGVRDAAGGLARSSSKATEDEHSD
ncbi:hypothetical protein FRC10_003293 [Ceratobasidium sp. 414]|nr:hypothetical protein FRC10_003293 [Ceratobasidium sp. 414]